MYIYIYPVAVCHGSFECTRSCECTGYLCDTYTCVYDFAHKKSTQIYHDIFTPFVCADTSQGILKVHKFISGTSMLADTRARMTRQDH